MSWQVVVAAAALTVAVAPALGSAPHTGLAPRASLISIKVAAQPDDVTPGIIAEGITEAAKDRAEIINVSVGTPHDGQALRQAVMYAEDHGCLIVASAGDADKPEYPGGDPGVISVSAVNRKGLPVSQVEPGHGARVSIYAPGADLFSTGKSGSANHGYQRDIHGSDYAVAYVSVAAALLLSAGTSVDPEQAGQLLVSSSMPVAGGIPGAGVLDPIAALAHLTPIPVSSAPVRASSSSPAPVHPSGLPALAVGLVIIFFLLVAFGLIATVRTIRIRNRARVMWPPLGQVPGQQPYEPASWDQTW